LRKHRIDLPHRHPPITPPIPRNGNNAWGSRRCVAPCCSEVNDMDNTINDVVIIGGGAAGLSAALVLGRARRRVVIVDAGAPRNPPAAHMQGFLSRDGMPPRELLAAGRAEVTGYGVEIIDGTVSSIEPGFVVHLTDGHTLRARRLLVTTGV